MVYVDIAGVKGECRLDEVVLEVLVILSMFLMFFFYYLLNLCIFRIMRGGEMGDILVYVGED